MTMRFFTDAIMIIRIVSREGTGRIFVPLTLAMSLMVGLLTQSLVLGLAVPVTIFLYIAFQTRSSPVNRRILARERDRIEREERP